ncbi:unnamed protein product [Rotaria sp. Silwood2]|nr:unnamed protein product [Rotaria sp. Silwood2]CAF4317063.1 unnamed protein product [Rotaria sp. Silwood2]
MSIEPEWYCPVIPSVLLNGAHDVGTGYLTGIPSYNPLTLFNNMKYYIQQGYYDCTRVVINDEEIVSFDKDRTGVALILYKKEGLNVTVSQRVDAYSYYFTVVINNGKENRDFMAISDYFVDGKFVNMESFIRKFCGKINKVVRKHKRKSRPPPPPRA